MQELERFVTAQSPIYSTALQELRDGSKQSHWMWFIFPQLDGLGTSSMTKLYAISGAAEARAYLAHPVLGPRLNECTQTISALRGPSIRDILGFPDYVKFQSCMTLFAEVAEDPELFTSALRKFFQGQRDARTLSESQVVI